MRKKLIYISLLLVSVLALGACSKQSDDGVLTHSQMVDVLYDYYLGQAMANNRHSNDTLSQEDYADMVLAKHGISQATFDASLLWYSRNNEEFYEIYKAINERLDNTLGTTVTSSSGIATRFATSGDTANIWIGRSIFLLLPTNYANSLYFTQATDTTLHAQDKIEWHFKSNFTYMNGNKSAIVLFAIRYDNDSIATAVNRIYDSGPQVLTLVAGSRPTKEVYGQIYLDEPIDNSNKLCLISDLALIRYKHKSLPSDTLTSPLTADTLSNTPDTLRLLDSTKNTGNTQRPHATTP